MDEHSKMIAGVSLIFQAWIAALLEEIETISPGSQDRIYENIHKHIDSVAQHMEDIDPAMAAAALDQIDRLREAIRKPDQPGSD